MHAGYMLLAVDHRLIQVCNTPSLRDIVVKQVRQASCCLGGHRISPGTERNEQFSVRIKCHIAVHHGADAHRTNPFKR